MADLTARDVVRELDAVVLVLDEHTDIDLGPYLEDLGEALGGLHAVLDHLPALPVPAAPLPPTF